VVFVLVSARPVSRALPCGVPGVWASPMGMAITVRHITRSNAIVGIIRLKILKFMRYILRLHVDEIIMHIP
jgi:hypothetical protein